MDAEKIAESVLQKLTGKRHIRFVSRGNEAIKLALSYAREMSDWLILQDQGGWMTYQQFGKKMGYGIVELKTDAGVVDPEAIPPGVCLFNAMPGYHALIDMEAIANKAEFLIADVSGSIGSVVIPGDIILGSFGKWKPIPLETGGFIASDDEAFVRFLDEHDLTHDIDFRKLLELLNSLPGRLKRWQEINETIREDLQGYTIIHKDSKGLNTIVAFKDEAEKQSIIAYCEKHKYGFVICPKDIRVKMDAISIEVKRILEV